MKSKSFCKKVKSFIEEEKMTRKKYKKMSFKKQAKQEAEHSKYFQEIYDKECR